MKVLASACCQDVITVGHDPKKSSKIVGFITPRCQRTWFIKRTSSAAGFLCYSNSCHLGYHKLNGLEERLVRLLPFSRFDNIISIEIQRKGSNADSNNWFDPPCANHPMSTVNGKLFKRKEMIDRLVVNMASIRYWSQNVTDAIVLFLEKKEAKSAEVSIKQTSMIKRLDCSSPRFPWLSADLICVQPLTSQLCRSWSS